MTKQLFSLPFKRAPLAHKLCQKGASMVETILVMPVIMLVGAGILHVALVAQAKSNLEYASLMAARIASSTPNFGLEAGGLGALETEIRKRMLASDPRNEEYSGLVRVCILRPNQAAFDDFGVGNLIPGSQAIPNDNLPFLSKDVGGSSGMTVQDANLLHLRVAYRFDSNVPFMNTFQVGGGQGAFMGGHAESRTPGRGTNSIWIQSDAVVVMQTPAALNGTTSRYIEGTGDYEACPP